MTAMASVNCHLDRIEKHPRDDLWMDAPVQGFLDYINQGGKNHPGHDTVP